MKKIYLLLIAILTISINAQNVLNTKLRVHNYTGNGVAGYLTEYNDNIIFSGNRPQEFGGNQLWSYNEASGKAKVIKNFNQGYQNYYSRIKSPIVKFQGKLYFIGTNLNDNNNQLWVSDGTEQGTKVVKQLYNSSAAYAYIDIFTNGDKLFIVTDYEFWSSDGTFAGTIALGSKNYKSQYYFLNNKLYYWENNYDKDVIMESDGTIAGTKIFKSFAPIQSSFSSVNFGMIKFQNQLFFIAKENGITSLWKTNGTDSGTQSILQIGDIMTLNGEALADRIVFYDSKNNLWTSDGNSANTKIVKSFTETISKIFKFKEKIYLDTNQKIWKTDGSLESTVPANLTSNDSGLDFLALSSKENFLIFKSSEQYNSSVWIADENENSAKKIKYGNGSGSSGFLEMNGHIFFQGLDGVAGTGISIHGSELYKYNIATKDDTLAADTNFSYNNYLSSYLKIDDYLFYIASTNSISQKQVFKKKINSDEVTQISNFTANIGTVDKTVKIGNYYYAYSNYNSNGIIKSGGNLDNTKFIPFTEQIISFNNFRDQAAVYITQSDKMRVYFLENSASVPVLLKEMSYSSSDYYSTVSKGYMLDGLLYFSFVDENNKWSIWKTDGTSANTKKAIEFPGENVQMLKITGTINSKLIFSKSNDVLHTFFDLYSSDGSQAGTSLLNNINRNVTNFSLENDGVLYFMAYKTGAMSLYKTDGTASGTALVKNIGSTYLSESSSYSFGNILLKCGNSMYILHNNIMWKSNGTAAGTTQLSANLIENEMACNKNYLYALTVTNPRIVRFGGILTLYEANIIDSNTNIEENYSVVSVPFKELASDGQTLYFSAYTNKTEYTQLEVIDEMPDLGISDEMIQNSKSKITLYPNPAKDFITITANNKEKVQHVEIIDATGKSVIKTSQSQNLDVRKLLPAVYYVKTFTSEGIYATKFIKL
ncbi:T9SS type A sorting domain-containing protein [Epilithonimonas sp. JDS]|uniref:T9SS type A sorting domain-containing protein n=1 Tax=Epilithonimonas sp. JDS TaxID=2902797 RepID=UPI001E40F700|nr:T9SS type A sorting domain-containing protein [Epilithonimonas sp. JDS]MCD9853776.1 T9SS type A sorting domain-containing protein [Epilithonimonas sp. JDS]